MVTQIQLGNFFSANGKTVLGGVGGSGIDTQALIKALTDARALPATQLQDQIDLNTTKSSALNSFKQLLSNFQSAADALRNPPGVNNAASNAFKFTTAALTSNTTISGSTYLSVTSSPGANLQSYTVTDIESLAAAKKQATAVINVADATSASAVAATPAGGQFQAGTFAIDGQEITLEDGDTLNEVAAKFNAVSDTTGITATVIKVADGQFKISFAATASGTENDFDLNDSGMGGTIDDDDGVLASVGITDTQQADDAVFTIDGIEITRSSNSISDVVDGLTFTLLQRTPVPEMDEDPTEITVTIAPDATTIQNSIVNFVDAYNLLREFAAQQTQLDDDGTYADTAVLANDSMFRSTMNSITSQVASIVDGIGSTSSLVDIGITFIDVPAGTDSEGNATPLIRNLLNVNDGALAAAIASDIDSVKRIFEFTFTTDNPNLRVFSRSNALGVTEFTLDIDVDLITPANSTFEATYDLGEGPVTIELDGTFISGNAGITLRGQTGTVLEGLVLVYASLDDATIEVTTTQGIADKAYNTATTAVEQDTGTIALALDALETTEDRLTAQIDRINEQVDQYREFLLKKFGLLEQAIASVNLLLASLDAQNQARQNNS